MTDNDLLNIYVLKNSGECVYHNEYSSSEKIQSDATIMSSFLSAIEMFSNDVDTGADMLETTNYRFVYHKKDDFIYVARTKKQSNPRKYSQGLSNIANIMSSKIPKFDGNVAPFRAITDIAEKEFFTASSENIYEFSGKYAKDLKGDEMKIYSYLRLKGRANLRTISKMMSISEIKAGQIASSLAEKEYLISYS